MTDPAQPEKPTKLDLFKELLRKKREARKKIIDERYADLSEYDETEKERHERIMNTPSAWTT